MTEQKKIARRIARRSRIDSRTYELLEHISHKGDSLSIYCDWVDGGLKARGCFENVDSEERAALSKASTIARYFMELRHTSVSPEAEHYNRTIYRLRRCQ